MPKRYRGKSTRRTFKRRKITKRRYIKRTKSSKPKNVSFKPLLRLKCKTEFATEQALSASATTPVIQGSELTDIDYTAGTRDFSKRSTDKISIRGVQLQFFLNNNASHGMWIRLICAKVREPQNFTTGALTGSSVLEVAEPTATEHKEDYDLTYANATNARNLMFKVSRELFSKVYLDKKVYLGPSGGSGSMETKLITKFIKMNQSAYYESDTNTTSKNCRIIWLAAAYDPTNDTSTDQTVEISYNTNIWWYDSIN